ncbi:MAG: ATP-binding protein, partial [Woeseia sp.]
LFEGRPLIIPFVYSMATGAEGVIFAWLIRSPLQQSYRLNRPLFFLAAFVVVIIASTAIGGLLGSAATELVFSEQNNPVWESWRIWFAADFLGILAITPLIGWYLIPQIRFRQSSPSVRDYLWLALMLLATGFLGLGVLEFDGKTPGDAAMALMLLASLAPLLWSAWRFVFPIAVAVQFAVVTSVIWIALYGHGPFSMVAIGSLAAMAEMQVYLIVMILAVLMFLFTMIERDRAMIELKMHRNVGKVLVALTEKLVAADHDELDSVVNDVLREIGLFAEADRCVLLEIDAARGAGTVSHRWEATEKTPPVREMIDLDLRQFPWLTEQIKNYGYVYFSDINGANDAAADELHLVRSWLPNVESLVLVGLITDGELVGAIGCSYFQKSAGWSDESLSLMYLIGQLFSNVMTRKKAERVIGHHQEKLRSLAADMAISEERARRRTAIDLHDGIGQNLAVARMKTGYLLANSDVAKDELSQVRSLIDDALRGTRHIIADLSPSILYELGLFPALQSLVERFELTNAVSCKVEESGESWSPDYDTRIGLYRAVQEFLNNAARHARAENVAIRLRWEANQVEIEVSDDGVGFDVRTVMEFSPADSSFGLFSVRETIELLGGSLAVESNPGIGTRIRLRVPLRESEV